MAGTQWPHPPGTRPRTVAARPEILAARQPHVDLRVSCETGQVRLQSCSGGLESIWLRVQESTGASVAYHAGEPRAVPVRLTPTDARRLAAVLLAYADSHPSVGEEL